MLRAFSSEDEGPFAEYNKTPRLIGTILLSIGVSLVSIGIILMFVAAIVYNRYERARYLNNQHSLRVQNESLERLQMSSNYSNDTTNGQMQVNSCTVHGPYFQEMRNPL